MCRSTFQKGPADGGRRRSVRVSITVFQGERKAWGEGTRGLFKPRRPHLADHRRLRGGRKRTFRNNYTGRIWPDVTTGADGDGPGLCRRRGAWGVCGSECAGRRPRARSGGRRAPGSVCVTAACARPSGSERRTAIPTEERGPKAAGNRQDAHERPRATVLGVSTLQTHCAAGSEGPKLPAAGRSQRLQRLGSERSWARPRPLGAWAGPAV